MMTFLEYLDSAPRPGSKLTSHEIELLYLCRDKLERSHYRKGLVDQTGKILNPFVWIAMPHDIGGGLRVYVVNGGIAIRFQAAPESLPVGKAYRVHGQKKRDEEEFQPINVRDVKVGSEDNKNEIDPTVLTNLMADISKVVSEIRKFRRDRVKALSMVPNVDPIPFKPFWPEPPNASPVY